MAASMRIIRFVFVSTNYKISSFNSRFSNQCPVLSCLPRQHYSNDSVKRDGKLNLAKPGDRRKEIVKNVKKTSEEEEGVEVELVAAVDEVVKSLGGDVQRTRSDLLRRLQEHSGRSQETVDESNVRSMFEGMKIEKTNETHDLKSGTRLSRGKSIREETLMSGSVVSAVFNESQRGGEVRRGRRELGGQRRESKEPWQDNGEPLRDESRPRRDSVTSRRDGDRQLREGGSGDGFKQRRNVREAADVSLFQGECLDIFQKSSTQTLQASTSTLFDVIQQEEFDLLKSYPPSNAFQEMIHWTNEAKLWTFPIDNEQGHAESRVGFHEHVFLEEHLTDFPKKGPVRHFMELVCVGLAKNPYYSAEEKRAHINWFREYFKDKYHIIDEAMAASAVSEQ